MKKKILSAITAVILCISLSVTAFAYDPFYEAYKKAAEAFHEKYPDVSVDQFMEEFLNGAFDAVNPEDYDEVIQKIINKLTPTTDPNKETTTKKTPTTRKPTTTEPTTKKEEPTTATPPFTIPSGLINNNNNGTTAAGSITIPQITENSSTTQNVPVVSMYQQSSPNIANNKPTAPVTDDQSVISSKTVMAWVIIAVGVMLLIVSIIVIFMSSADKRGGSPRGGKRRKMRSKDSVRKDYVPFTEAPMPEVTVNTAAQLAERKRLTSSLSDEEAKLLFGDETTASALDSAITVSAEAVSTGSVIASESKADETVAQQLLKSSVKTVRICEECGETVPEDMMFCPGCGNFMGIVESSPEDNTPSAENANDSSDIIPESADSDIQPKENIGTQPADSDIQPADETVTAE